MSLAWLKGAIPTLLPVGLIAGALFLFQSARIDGLLEDAARKDAELAARDAAIAELRGESLRLGAILEEFSHETMDIKELRSAMRHEFKTAMRDPGFAAWADHTLPSQIAARGKASLAPLRGELSLPSQIAAASKASRECSSAGVPRGGLLGKARAASDTPHAAPGAGAGGEAP